MADAQVMPMPTDAKGLMQQMYKGATEQSDIMKGRETAIEESGKRVESLMAEKAARTAPYIQAITEKVGKTPELGEMAPIPQAPQRPQINDKEMGETLSLITGIAALGGLLTRQPITAALNSFSAGVQGYVQGKQQVFEDSLKQFRSSLEQAKSVNQETLDKYKAAMEKHKGDLAGMQAALQVVAAESQNPIDIELARQGNLVKLMETAGKRLDEMNRAMTSAAQMAERAGYHQELMADRREARQDRQDAAARKLALAEESLALRKQQLAQKEKPASMPKAEQQKMDARNDLLADAAMVLELIKQRPQGVGAETALGDLAMSYWDKEGIPLRSALARLQANYSFGQGGKALTGPERTILAPVTEWKGKSAGAIETQVETLIDAIQRGNADLLRRYSSPTSGATGSFGGHTAPTKITSDAEYDALPSGTQFIAPDGTTRKKP